MGFHDKRFFTGFFSIALLIFFNCAYYNTFYNAKKAYNSGYKAVQQSREGGGAGKAQFEIAIRKASKVLELHEGSKYVDDALLLLGKSFYYTGQLEEALRKFDELKSNYPQSNLIPEGELYRAKIFLKRENYYNAEEVLRSITDMKAKEDIQYEIRLSLAELLEFNGEYSDAITEYQKIIDSIKKNKIRSQAQFAKGECYMQIEQYDSAAAEYEKVPKYKPEFLLKFQSALNYGIAKKKAGKIQEAKDIFYSLLKNSVYYDFFQDVELQIADCIFLEGNIEESEKAYYKIIEENPKTEFSQQAYYNIGEILATNEFNLDSAIVRYKQAAAEKGGTKLIEDINKKITVLSTVTTSYNAIKPINLNGDSLETVTLPDSVTADSTIFAGDETVEIPEFLPIPDQPQIQGELEGYARTIEYPFEASRSLVGATIKTRALVSTNGMVEKVEIVHDEPKYSFAASTELGARTLLFSPAKLDGKPVKFWLDIDFKFISRGEGNDEEKVEIIINRKEPPKKEDLSANLSFTKNLAQSEIKEIDDSKEFQEANDRFVVAEYFLDLAETDSALNQLNLIAERCPNTVLAPKAYYLIAHIYEENIPQPDSSKKYYDMIIEKYPDSPYGQSSWEKAGNEGKINEDKELIRKEFNEAENLYLEQKDYSGAIARFHRFIENYPDNDLIPKSLFTIAWIFENKLAEPDSAIAYFTLLSEQYENYDYGKKAKELLEKRRLALKINTDYNYAEKTLTNKIDYYGAVNLYSQFPTTYKNLDLSAKSLLNAGWLYQDAIGDIQKAIQNYYKLINEYPFSRYAPLARDMIEYLKTYFTTEIIELKPDQVSSFDNRRGENNIKWEQRAIPREGVKNFARNFTYPESEFKNLVVDTLTIKTEIDDEGLVESAEILSGNDSSPFKTSVISYIKETLFTPARDDKGKPKKNTQYYQFNFAISKFLFEGKLLDYPAIGEISLFNDSSIVEPTVLTNVDSLFKKFCYINFQNLTQIFPQIKEKTVSVQYRINQEGKPVGASAVTDSASALTASVAQRVNQLVFEKPELSGASTDYTYIFRYTFSKKQADTTQTEVSGIPPLLPKKDRARLLDTQQELRARITYPDTAITMRVTGRCIVDAYIDRNGRVLQVLKVKGPGMGLSDSLKKAIETARFSPGHYNGIPVKSYRTVRMDFELKPVYLLPEAEVPYFFPFDNEPVLLDTLTALTENIKYPQSAHKDSVYGDVILKIHLDKSGNVQKTDVLKTPGEEFTDSVQAAINKTAFEPAYLNGYPVRSWHIFRYSFAPPENELSQLRYKSVKQK